VRGVWGQLTPGVVRFIRFPLTGSEGGFPATHIHATFACMQRFRRSGNDVVDPRATTDLVFEGEVTHQEHRVCHGVMGRL